MWTTLQKLLLVLSTKSSDAPSYAFDRIFERLFLDHFHTEPRWVIHGDFRKNLPRSRSTHNVDSICMMLIYNLLKWYIPVNNPIRGVDNLKIQTEIYRVFHGFNSPITTMRFTLKKRFELYGV